MKLKGIDFGHIIGASGVQGFFSGKEYPHYSWYQYIPGYSFKHMTFCAKTMTLHPRKGNARLGEDKISFVDKLPDCIYPEGTRGIALNAVSLSNPGATFLLEKRIWQGWKKPFMLSFMSVESTPEKRLDESHKFVELLLKYLNKFESPFGIQLNFSCPNTGHDYNELLGEIDETLNAFSLLNNVPIIPKINMLVSPFAAKQIAIHPNCDALCVSNTIPYGAIPDKIDWTHLFGSTDKEKSPLAKYGGGGLSGSILFPLLCDWLKEADEIKIGIPIIAGGGIMKTDNAVQLANYKCVKAVSIGTVAMLRPWRVQGIIKKANSITF